MSTVLGEWEGCTNDSLSSPDYPPLSTETDLVAELNQTVIDVQRTDSMMAVSTAPVAG